MAVVRVVLTPQAAVARTQSEQTLAVSESGFQGQPRFERAFALLGQAFDIKTFSQLANVLVALLTPAAMLALVMGLWRVAADLGWAGAFLVTGGFFSHWQVWIAFSAGLKMLSSGLLAWAARSGKFSEEN